MGNQLFYGDNLDVLRKYIKEDTAQAQAFIDTWTWDDFANQGLAEIFDNYYGRFTSQVIDLIAGLTKVLGKGSLLAYLISMTLRIVEIHRVLKPTGSFYLHCDPTSSHYLKLVLDAIFCSQGGDYRNEIIWHYGQRTNFNKGHFSKKHDIIFFYVKTKNTSINRVSIPWLKQDFLSHRHDVKIDKNGLEFIWTDGGKKGVRYKRYVNDVLLEGKPLDSVWDIPILNSSAKERLGYPTQKPEALLERIIKASSNEGDIILDAYCGCGTTVSVAQRLNRQWIGIDITYQSISLILKRLEDAFGKGVLEQINLNGIPKDMESAILLANKKDDRTRKEFEKWAVLTYTNNRATINQKKGSDRGIDGTAYFQGDKDDPEKIILQVKSGKVKSGDIRDLQGTMTLEQAAVGIFITLQEPTQDMIQTAKAAGIYQSRYMSQSCDRIQIVTIQEILKDKKRLHIRLSYEVLKSAEKQMEVKVSQIQLEI